MKRFIYLLNSLLESLSPKLSARFCLNLFFTPTKPKLSSEQSSFRDSGQLVILSSGCKGRIYGDGEKLIWLVHGWSSCGPHFMKLANNLVENGYQVMLWDGPAHGESPGRQTNLVEFSENLKTDIENHHQKKVYAILGHSFGAAAVAYALKLGLQANKIILISAPVNIDLILSGFFSLLGLKLETQSLFKSELEKRTGVPISSVSLDRFISSIEKKITLVHDKNDKEVDFCAAAQLAGRFNKVKLIETQKLGHRRILRTHELYEIIKSELVA